MTRSRLLGAIAEGDVTRVAALLRPDTVLNPAQGTTPLYRAAIAGHHEIVRLLLEYGADPDQPSGGEDEGLALCAAACWDHAETVQALLDGGANPDAGERQGWTALLWAALFGNLRSADVLLDAGAGPDVANDDGDTPLTLAARFGAYGLVWSLLEHGADPALPGTGGATPLEVAWRWSQADLEAVLREEATAQAEPGCTLLTAKSHAADGTRLLTVEARCHGRGYTVSRQYGHAAIATALEAALGIRTPVEKLLRRALPYRAIDQDDETWRAAVRAVRQRHDDETFATAARLCGGEDPVEREFGAEVLAGRHHAEDALPILREMARRERDPAVVEALLHALGRMADQRALPEVLEIINWPGRTTAAYDPLVLSAVLPPDDGEGVAALIRLSEHPDDEVRVRATVGIADLTADTSRIREALAARLTDRDLTTAAEAARGLAARGDRRAVEGIHRVLCRDDGDDYARELALEAAQRLGLEISEDRRTP